jgi:hypothetical protein
MESLMIASTWWRKRRAASFLLAVCSLVAWMIGNAHSLAGQTVAVEALVDAELWKTDDGSLLLARNNGRLAPQFRLTGWAAYQPSSLFDIIGVGTTGAGYTQRDRTDASLQLLEMRFTPRRWLNVQAGKMLSPMGTFGARHYSNVNPLIGQPDLYPPQYPWGVTASGVVGPVDYRAGMVSLPTVNPRYSPPPSQRLRPVARIGMRFGPEMHIGASVTKGPYLGSNVAAQLPPGKTWHEYNQTVRAADLRVSYGYFESHLEAAWSSYETPAAGKTVHGFGWYDEARFTLSPRLFAAARVEHFRYAFVGVFPPKYWIAAETIERNAEVGFGYRLSESALFKFSYARDIWPGEPRVGAPPLPDGHALMAQFSYHWNVSDMIAGKY